MFMNISYFVQGFFTGKDWIFISRHYRMKKSKGDSKRDRRKNSKDQGIFAERIVL